MTVEDFLKQFEGINPKKQILFRTDINGELVLIDNVTIREVFVDSKSLHNDGIQYSFNPDHFDTSVITI